MFRLIAVDVDETLLDDDKNLSLRNIEAIKAVQGLGIPVVLCSARAPQSCFPLASKFDGKDPIVTHNGAVVVDPDGKIRLIRTIDRDMLAKTLELCRQLELHYDVNGVDKVYVESLEDWMKATYREYYVNPILVDDILAVPDLKPVRVMLCGEPAEVKKAFFWFEKMDLSSLSVVRSGSRFIDIRHREARKETGVRYLAKEMGIGPKEVMAIGNYYNDISLLQWAGLGVAVANAPDLVREAADVVVSSNNDSGVGEALERFILSADC